MPSARPKILALDGQGVVFSAPFREFLACFADRNSLSFDVVEDRWDREVRMKAWSGAIEDREIWEKLADQPIDHDATMHALRESYAPGPAASYLTEWSGKIPIWLVSNHRAAWLMPHLENWGLAGAFERLLFSDLTGHVKPDLEAFHQLLEPLLRPEDILFVDDHQPNLEAAGSLGIRTLHATPRSSWVETIDQILER